MPNKQSKYYVKLTKLTVLLHLFYSILMPILFWDAYFFLVGSILFLINSITTLILNFFIFIKLRWKAEFILPGIFHLMIAMYVTQEYSSDNLIFSTYGLISIGCGIYIRVRVNQGRLLKDKN